MWSDTVIFLTNVAKYYGGKPLLKDVNISVHRGDRIGIVGPNGAGKSTILGMMEGTIRPDEGDVSIEKRIRKGVLRQEIIAGGDGPIIEEVMNVTDELRHIRERLAVLEERMERLSEDSEDVESLLEEHGRLQLEFERYDGYSLEARALKVLEGLGFPAADAHRSWSEFSGGWRMRVALAKILLAEPDALLLDEPTNHLDLESLIWVEQYLSQYKGALVLVSHDRAFLNRLVHKIIEVDRGKAVTYTGNYDQFEKSKSMQEEVQLAAYKNQQEKVKRIQKFIDQNRVKARTASRVQSRVKMLEKLEHVEPPSQQRTVNFSFPQPSRTGRRVLEIRDLVKRYDHITVYNGFSFTMERGDRVGLVGPNGAGKSTLLKIMAGVLPHDGGTVKYGHLVTPGYFAQHQYENLSPDRSVLEEAAAASSSATEQEVRTLLGAFLFSGDDVFKRVKVLSGGEKSRLALTKLLLAPPNLMLLDEPTNHLDIPSCRILEDALKKFEGSVVLITHDRRLMNAICTGILEIERGSAEYYVGSYDDYQYKKAKDAEVAAMPEPSTPALPLDDSGDKTSRKHEKRRQAKVRQESAKKKAPILEEVKRIENELAAKDMRIKEIRDLMADPANYENREMILPLLEEEPALSREIDRLEAQWEELQQRLEQIDANAASA